LLLPGSVTPRTDRYNDDKRPDNRNPAQRDRDRILYTSAFRRLARVTQVVSADEGHVFHNRLTHSIQVAQVGRRLAEKLLREQQVLAAPTIDPDVVEAACLAHDLGHPPFGHIAEKELDRLATATCLPDGFEGNAQSFRIVTALASASSIAPGLNLTRATLNAVLKYPWLRGEHPKIKDKWGAYESERPQFNWARELEKVPERKLSQSPEAYLMDIADDITYSVHDVDDFYRVGLIPIDRLRIDPRERTRFYDEVFQRREGKLPADMDSSYLQQAFDGLISRIPQEKPYEGTKRDRGLLRDLTATLIGDFIRAISIEAGESEMPRVSMIKERRAEVFMLKQLTWHYVIKNPALASQQQGQRTMVRELFSIFRKAAVDRDDQNLDVFPIRVREDLSAIQLSGRPTWTQEATRVVVDLIASLTEEQAIEMHHRLTGISLGSALLHRLK
jgi:dGTPase